MPSELQVIVSGIKFVLTQDQFKVDGPNYFTDAVAAHTGHFRGPQVKVSRNPELFKLVVDFLNGYDVMPQGAPPPAGIASREVALRNLIAEAKFYRLSSLENIAQEGLRQLETKSVTRHVMLSRKATTNDWGLPSFIASDVAKELHEEHGISAYVLHTSGLTDTHADLLRKVGIRVVSVESSVGGAERRRYYPNNYSFDCF